MKMHHDCFRVTRRDYWIEERMWRVLIFLSVDMVQFVLYPCTFHASRHSFDSQYMNNQDQRSKSYNISNEQTHIGSKNKSMDIPKSSQQETRH